MADQQTTSSSLLAGLATNTSDYMDEGMWPEYCNPLYLMPDEIDVRVSVAGPDGAPQEYVFPVKIEKMQGSKAYLGGFRNRMSGKLYHHAGSQTPRLSSSSLNGGSRKEVDYSHLRTRETQTMEERTVSVQVTREGGTQMQRADLILDNKNDRFVTPRVYFSSDQLLRLKIVKVTIMQRYWRGYMARQTARKKRERIVAYERRLAEEASASVQRGAEQREQEMKRRLHPQSNEDFARLYNELDAWRKEEVDKIKARTAANSDDRVRAMNEVLFNETQVLQSIRKLKVAAKLTTHEMKTQRLLGLMAQPQRWQCSDGKTAFVHTPEVQRAKELMELYSALMRPFETVDDRLDVLVHIKWTLGRHQTELTREAIDLVNREADLLNRGRPFAAMAGLRSRIENLFLQFVEDPQYNPRAAEFIKAPTAGSAAARDKTASAP